MKRKPDILPTQLSSTAYCNDDDCVMTLHQPPQPVTAGWCKELGRGRLCSAKTQRAIIAQHTNASLPVGNRDELHCTTQEQLLRQRIVGCWMGVHLVMLLTSVQVFVLANDSPGCVSPTFIGHKEAGRRLAISCLSWPSSVLAADITGPSWLVNHFDLVCACCCFTESVRGTHHQPHSPTHLVDDARDFGCHHNLQDTALSGGCTH